MDPAMTAMIGMAKSTLSGIREIRFSLLDNGTPEPDVVALIEGHFDESLIAMLGQADAKYRRMDNNTFLFGNGPSLEKAAARMALTTPLLQPRALAGTEALASYDLWLSGNLPDLAMVKGLKLDVRGLALGLSLHDNLEMELAMDTPSPAAAEALLKSAHEAEAAQPVQYRGMLRSFADGNTARFRVNVPREAALEAMRTRTASPTVTASNTPQPLSVAPKPRRSTILIQGLEGGPREIPLQ